MPKLKCKAENCAYNYDWLCRKNTIDVDGPSSKCKNQTCCKSFCDKSDNSLDTEFATFDRMPSIHTEIYCDAVNCVYEKIKSVLQIELKFLMMVKLIRNITLIVKLLNLLIKSGNTTFIFT